MPHDKGRLWFAQSLRWEKPWRGLPDGVMPSRGTAAARMADIVRASFVVAALVLVLAAVLWTAILVGRSGEADRAAEDAAIAARQTALALRLAQLDLLHPDSGDLAAFDATLAQLRRDQSRMAQQAETGAEAALRELYAGQGYALRARLADLFALAERARTVDDTTTAAQLAAALRQELVGPLAERLTRAADGFAARAQERSRRVARGLEWAAATLGLLALAWLPMIWTLDRRLRRTLGLLEFLAARDALTGALTHTAFLARLHRLLQSGPLGVVLLDLDNFHGLNATSGDAAGDAALRAVAHRLRRAAGPQSLVARMGSDSFGVAIPGIAGGHAGLAGLAAQLLAVLRDPIAFDGQRLRIGASAGTALAPDDSAERVELLRMAEVAVREAKRHGKGTARAFHSVEPAAQERREAVLRALTRGELDGVEPWLQPLVACDTGWPVRFEVLARWTHPTLGRIPPAEFLPIAEAVGRLPLLSARVRDAAFLTLAGVHRDWPQTMGRPPGLAVNLVPSELATPGLLPALDAALAAAELTPAALTIEVTEDLLIEGADTASLTMLQTLRRRGARVNLDNFGSGVANLTHLRDFEMDGLKIARSFIAAIGRDERSETIIRGMLGLCRGLGIEAVAEGIETEAQLAFIRDAGCDVAQGFHIGAPMPPGDVAAWLAGLSRAG